MYSETHTVKLNHTDAAGVIFYGRLFELGQEVVENYLNSIGFGIGEMLRSKDFITPVVHCDADYTLPMRVGDVIKINISMEKIGGSSFTTFYEFLNEEGHLCAKAHTTNVTIRKNTGKTIPIHPEMRAEMEKNKKI